ncbi:MAG: hypothetical protein LBV43_06940 [Prevotella sp.]|jgi:hypothetical protein|nr:hypothetical protein [Prevotella sp.]
MESKFNEQESLQLINQMINQAKSNLQTTSSSSLIFWGYTVSLAAILNFILMHVLNHSYDSFHVWWLMVPATIISLIMEKNRKKKALVTTHLDNIIASVWLGFLISVITLLLTSCGLVFTVKSWNIVLVITPIILTLMGLAQFATAAACKYKPFYYSAYIFWGGAIFCMLSFLILNRGDVQFIILAVCMILGFCIPGHIINRKIKKNV